MTTSRINARARQGNAVGVEQGAELRRRIEQAQMTRRGLLKSAAAVGGGAAAAALTGSAVLPRGFAVAAVQQNSQIPIFATVVDIPNIDPAIGHDGAISTTQKHVYDTLYRHIGDPPELVPWLATGHEVSDDATEWTFTLDERATFQDGSPVTADAIVYSFQRLLAINQGVAWMFTGILSEDGVEALDDHTVRFTLDEPFAPFLHATTWLFVLNPAVVQEHEQDGDMGRAWLESNSAGSGPFIIERWEPNNLYQFAADPSYWRGWEEPHIDGYVHQVSLESSTKRIALEQGEIHMADWLSPEDKTLLDGHPEVIVPRETSISTYTIKMNTSRGPTADVHVRRAISYAFDYEAMVDAMAGFAERINGPLAPSLPGAREGAPVYETDLERAREELAQSAEWADGFELEYFYVTGLEEERVTGLILLDQLSQLNIDVSITGIEWANAVAMFGDPEESPLMFPIYSGSDYPDPDNYLWQSFHSTSAGTWTGANHYSNPEVDDLLEQARRTTDQAERDALYEQVQQIVIDEAVEVYLWSPLEGYPHRQEVQGYQYSPVMGSDPNWMDITLS